MMRAEDRSSECGLPAKLNSQLLRDEPELADVVREFVDVLPTRLAEMKAAFEQSDWKALTTLAHRLKGAGGSYGYPDISQLCATMERSFRAEQAGEFQNWTHQLDALVRAAQAGLEDYGDARSARAQYP